MKCGDIKEVAQVSHSQLAKPELNHHQFVNPQPHIFIHPDIWPVQPS